MGLYLNQLPQTEVARLKAELAETLIANFCYPRFYDYRIGALRTRPVDRAKRQEVWQYLNAVDFNVWGRVDVDSPDFQRQVERLFIHFVQRNRSFFGEQGRKRMTDVRSLITTCSTALADGLRGHLRGQHGISPFGNPRAVTSWVASNITGRVEAPWEQVLSGTMLLQQQLQETRGEVRPASAPVQTPAGRQSSVPARRSRSTRSVANGSGNGNAVHEDDVAGWPTTNSRTGRLTDGASSLSSSIPGRDNEFTPSEFPSLSSAPDAAPTLPLPLNKVESIAVTFQPAPTEISPPLPPRSRRSKPVEVPPPAAPFVAPPPSDPLSRQVSQPLPTSSAIASTPIARPQLAPAAAWSANLTGGTVQAEGNGTATVSEEDVVIFEQMRHQLSIWLRIEAVRAGIEPGSQDLFQLVDILRHQEDVDNSRLQVVSTLLNMCDQIIAGGRATLLDYKQAMMFYLMHTRRGQ